MGQRKGKGTPQIRKLTKKDLAAAANTNNTVRGKRRVVIGGIVKWIPIGRKPPY